ncbi:MAG: SpoVR family protein [Hydrogenibacillus sp.]|nr:SpoVR family protein [Hydrogenibacillus sp.]
MDTRRLRRADDDRALRTAIAEITEVAKGFGLDFFPMRFHIVPADVMYAIGAFGMPTRFAHWRFGKAYYKMKMQYDLGLSKIYELVINSDPCEAFLYEGNSLLQNKLIIAHVLAHSDFFKNNVYFAKTNRKMVDSMAASAERIRRYEIAYGEKRVEAFLDAVLAIQEHIDPYGTAREDGFWWERHLDGGSRAGGSTADRLKARFRAGGRVGDPGEHEAPRGRGETHKDARRPGDYADLWALVHDPPTRFPPEPEKDVLLFILRYSSVLQPWQRDVMTVVHDEMRYFWPQMETKIMNEGWATYWHQRIMRALDLSPEEAWEYAKMHAEVVQPSRATVNPYLLGWKLFEAIEALYDDPPEALYRRGVRSGSGREKIFEVRELGSDVSFLRNYLTKEVVEALDLFVYQKQGDDWRVATTDWEAVREALIRQRTNGGFPTIVVEDGDFERSGALLLRHVYDGLELDARYIEKTLPYVYALWGRPVHLLTVTCGKAVRFSYDGKAHTREPV